MQIAGKSAKPYLLLSGLQREAHRRQGRGEPLQRRSRISAFPMSALRQTVRNLQQSDQTQEPDSRGGKAPEEDLSHLRQGLLGPEGFEAAREASARAFGAIALFPMRNDIELKVRLESTRQRSS